LIALLAAALMSAAPQADAPRGADPSLLPSDAPVKTGVDLTTRRSRSVYEIHWAVDIPVSVVGGSLGLVRLFGTNSLVRKTCPCDPATLNGLDRGAVGNHSQAASVASDITLGVVLAAPPILDFFDLGIGWPLLEDLVILFEAIMVDTGIQATTALLVSRPRPVTYSGDPRFVLGGEGYVSFYAGHVSTVVATLAVVAHTLRLRYGERIWPWVLMILVGASVAIERVEYGFHFPTDVIAGSLAGLAIGIGTPWLHTRKAGIEIGLVPAPGGFGAVAVF